MTRFLILMIALFFGGYAQYNAGVKIQTSEKIDAMSKNIGSAMSQKISQHREHCKDAMTCKEAVLHQSEALSHDKMDSLLSKAIYAELSKY
ncbi:MAG: hypothetical protein KI791_12940 [Cyclobacteriaceae bacterium]|nr:hypothetical protein [Cyclobacteriaceae bacterium SS2]